MVDFGVIFHKLPIVTMIIAILAVCSRGGAGEGVDRYNIHTERMCITGTWLLTGKQVFSFMNQSSSRL